MPPYTLIRARRKTVSLRVTEAGKLTVRAPLHLPRADIDRFVREKAEWIETQTRRMLECQARREAFAPGLGGTLPVFGQPCPIERGERPGFDGRCFLLPEGLSAEQSKATLEKIYRLLARKALTQKTAEYAARMGVTPEGVRISGAKTRWGSCSGQNRLSFSWRLMMAAEPAVDYVVVHELAHIKEHNHSPRFWAEVERVFPDTHARRQLLKATQAELMGMDW